MSLLWPMCAALLPSALGAGLLALLSARPRGLQDWLWLLSAGWLLGVLLIGALLPRLPLAPSDAPLMVGGPLLLLALCTAASAWRRWRSSAGATAGDPAASSSPQPDPEAQRAIAAADEELRAAFTEELEQRLGEVSGALAVFANVSDPPALAGAEVQATHPSPPASQQADEDAARAAGEALRRHMHAIKGSARMLGLDALGELAAALESGLKTRPGDGPRAAAARGLLQAAAERMHAYLPALAEPQQAPPALADLIRSAEAWARGAPIAPVLAASAQPSRGTASSSSSSLAPPRTRWLPWLAALLLVQFVLLLHQAALLPSYPWDAWTTWLLRARVWLEQDSFLPLIGFHAWLGGEGTGLPTLAPSYPLAVSGVAAWFSAGSGGWNEAAAHLPWPLAWLAGAVALWSGLLRAGCGARVAELSSFAWASLPMLSAHAALAGYADAWVGLLVLLAGLAALQLRQRERASWMVLALALLLLTQVKIEGWIWAGALAAGLGYALLSLRLRRIAGVVAAVGALIALLMLTVLPLSLELPLIGALKIGPGQIQLGPIQASLAPQNVLPELAWTLWGLPHWHLLWLLLPLALLLGLRRASMGGDRDGFALPLLAIATVLGLLFLILVFGFSQHAMWLKDLTSINRLLMHWLPLPLLLAAWLWREARDPAHAIKDGSAPADAAA